MTDITSWVAALGLLSLPLANHSLFRMGINFSFANIFFLLFLLLFVGGAITGRYTIVTASKVLYLALAGLCIWVFISSFAALDTSATQNRLSTVYGAVLFIVLGAFASYYTPNDRVWGVPVTIAAVAAAVVGLAHYLDILPLFEFERHQVSAREFGGYEFQAGGTGLIGTRGSYGIWLLAGAVFAARIVLTSKRRLVKLLAGLCLPVIGVAIVVSLSRSSWLAASSVAATGFVLVWPASVSSLRKRRVRRAVSLLIIGVVVFLLLASGTANMLSREIVAMQPVTFQGRFDGMYNAYIAFLDSPFYGQGATTYLLYQSTGKVFHNTFLGLLAAHGLPAFLFLVIMLGTSIYQIFRALLKDTGHHERLSLYLWLAWLAGALVELSAFEGTTSKQFWAVFGLMSGEAQRIRVENALKKRRAAV